MKTGRPPISDAEKKRRGTFDPRWSEEKRAARAQNNVVALFGADAVASIPEPPAGLSERAKAEYERWTRRLFELGRLTQVWLDKITLYAIRRHAIETRLAEGGLPKQDDQKACEMFLKELAALNVDAPQAGQTPGEGRFRRVAALSQMAARPPS